MKQNWSDYQAVQAILSLCRCPLSPLHILLPLLGCCAPAHSPHCSACPFSIYLCFSVHPLSVFLLDRGAPASETQAWDLPLPQLPHPLHRHSAPSWFWLSGLWSRLCPQSHHPTPSLHYPLRLCLAEKERVLHWGPAAGSLRYSRTTVCHQVTAYHTVALAPLSYIGSTAGPFTPRLTWLLLSETLTQHACCNCPERPMKQHYWLIFLSSTQDSPASACGLMCLSGIPRPYSRSRYLCLNKRKY